MRTPPLSKSGIRLTRVRFRSGMAKLDLQLVHVASGAILAQTLEKPRTFVGRGLGLMFRRSLPDGHGMLIDPCNGIHMLFMRFPPAALFLDRLDRVKRVYRRGAALGGGGGGGRGGRERGGE